MSTYTQFCDYDGCNASGEYRAPKSRNPNEGFYYFCLEHIRLYNKQWDYFKGMSTDEVIAHRISDITWRRPTWSAKGINMIMHRVTEHPFFSDPIGIVRFNPASAANRFPPPRGNTPEFKAMNTLKLDYPFSSEGLKKHYLKLVKTYHPDTNAGCRQSEERLKRITVAYKILCKYLNRFSSR